MNLALYIYNYLQERGGSIKIPNFGTFSVLKIHAKVDEKASKILPPKDVIYFEKDEIAGEDTQLIEYISAQTAETLVKVQSKVITEIEQWNRELLINKKLNLDSLGVIEIVGNIEVVFTQQEIPNSMEYFGLEEISLLEIAESSKDDTFKKAILWGFLVIIPLVVLVFLGIGHKDFILGNATFENTHRIEDRPILKNDSIKKDSVVLDTINREILHSETK